MPQSTHLVPKDGTTVSLVLLVATALFSTLHGALIEVVVIAGIRHELEDLFEDGADDRLVTDVDDGKIGGMLKLVD